jgi:predicted alpha/beta-hydrolase family hydrolase
MLHRPDNPNGHAIVLTHGAGSSSDAPLLVKLATDFADAGYFVMRYDLPFRINGKAPSPAQAVHDREGVRQAVAEARKFTKGRVIAGGHSYGGRQTAMAAAETPGLADGLLLLSYPLHPPGNPDKLRTDYFPNLNTPALFVHGARDPFGAVDELRAAVKAIPARTEVLAIEGAAHDLKKAMTRSAEILALLESLAG